MTTALSTGLRKVATRFAPDPTPDGELLSRFLTTRDESAFAVLVRRHAGMVFGTCRRVLGNATDADDAFQAAFVVLVRKAHSLTDRACVGNYLYGVAFHTALKARAMATKRKAKEAKANRPDAADQIELSRVLDEELAKLPEKYREPVVLCELEGVSRKDAAKRLGIPEGTISNRLATAHRMLEKRLKSRGFAAVGLSAILGSQSFAVTESLTNAAVRAVTSTAPAGVTHLASEVTKMFLLNKLKVGTAVLASVVLLLGVGVGMAQRGVAGQPALRAPVPEKKAVKKDEDLIQGLWQAESVEGEGQLAPATELERFQFRFKGDKVTPPLEDQDYTFVLDTTANPKTMDVTATGGPMKGKTRENTIYELDGDTLKICIDKRVKGGTRPTEFKTAPGDGRTLIVLKRVKEEKKDDAMAIQSTWVVTEWKQTGVQQEEGLKKLLADGGYKITFTADTMTYEFDQSSLKYTLDPLKDPKQMQCLTPGGGLALGIYELKGDDLKMCIGRTVDPKGKVPPIAPAAFDTDNAPAGTSLFVLKRVKEENKDEDRIQGLWQAESLEAGGQKAPDAAVRAFQLRFKGNNVTFVIDDRTHTFDLDTSAKPKALNLTPGDGTDKGKKLECAIYELDGDTLKICIDKEGQSGKRPTEFKTTAGDGLALMALKRVKEEKKEQAKKPDDVTKLLGKWERKSQTYDPPLKAVATGLVVVPSAEWTFATTGLTIESNALGQVHVSDLRYTIDASASPKELTLVGKTGLKSQCIYDLDGDTLKVAMFGISEKARPRGFKATADDPKDAGSLLVEVYERVKEDNSYSLKAGEVLKLIPAPFSDGRDEIYTKFDAAGGIKPAPPADDRLMAVTVDKDKGQPVGANAFTNRRTPGAETPGQPLASFLKHSLRIDMTKVADPSGLLESTILDADVVLKKGATQTDLLAALRKEMKAKCGVDLVLEFRDTEMLAVVISGKHTLKADPPADPTRPHDTAPEVHLYATDKQEQASGTHGDTGHLPAELARFLGRPVIDESDLTKNKVLATTRYHERYPATPKTRAEDRDPEKVLQNLSNQTGLVFRLGKQKVRALVVEQPKQELAWKTEFRKAYGLTDGQLVRRVAPPYPDCREEYFKNLMPGRQGNIPFDQWFAVLGWKDGWTKDGVGGYSMPIKPDEGVPLERLLDMTLKFPKTRIESDKTTMERKVIGDFVVRVGADLEKMAAALEALLRKELEVPVKFSFKDAEEEVFVLSGKYTARPLDGKKDGRIEVYAGHLTDRTTGGGGSGTLKEMTDAVERWVNKPVVLGKIEGGPAKVEWHYNARDRVTREEYEEDRNAPRVLANLAEQTGLTVTTEKRKVRMLVVEHAEVKKDENAKQQPDLQAEFDKLYALAWKAEFDSLYALKDGEVVKYVLADKPAAKATRTDYYRDVIARGKKGAEPLPGTVLTFAFDQGMVKWRSVGGGATDGVGKTGAALEHVIGWVLEEADGVALQLDPKLSGVYLPGDWVIRRGASLKDRLAALERVLATDCKLAVKLNLTDVERDVLVASGDYIAAPRAWRPGGEIDVYALEKVVDKKLSADGQYLKGSGDFDKFLRDVGGFAGKRVVAGNIKNEPKAIKWYLHERNSDKPAEQQEDHDADAILKMVSDQTGLTFKAEKRKMPVLVVEAKR